MQSGTRLAQTLALLAVYGTACGLVAGCAGGNAIHDRAAVDAQLAKPNLDAPLGSWRLTPQVGAGAVTFVVVEGGGFSGTGPCNGYFGKWTLGAEQSTLGPVGATRKMCAEDAMDREQLFFAALGRTAGWRSTATGIDLVDVEGTTVLTFVAGD